MILVALALAAGSSGCRASREDPRPSAASGAGDTGGPAPGADAGGSPTLPTHPSATAEIPAIAELGPIVGIARFPSGVRPAELETLFARVGNGVGGMFAIGFATMIASLTGTSPGSIKLDAPIIAVLVDPTQYDQPLVWIVEPIDADALESAARAAGLDVREHEGRAFIGTKDAVAAIEAKNLDMLREAAPHTQIDLYPAHLVETAGSRLNDRIVQATSASPELGRILTQGRASLGEHFIEEFLAQVDRVTFSSATGTASFELYVRVHPHIGSGLDRFVKAQTPTDHALLSRLPAMAPPAFVISGQLALALDRAWINRVVEAVSPATDPAILAAHLDASWKFADAIDGRMAATLGAAHGEISQSEVSTIALYGLQRAEAGPSAWAALVWLADETAKQVAAAGSGLEGAALAGGPQNSPKGTLYVEVPFAGGIRTGDPATLFRLGAEPMRRGHAFVHRDVLAIVVQPGAHDVDDLTAVLDGDGATFEPAPFLAGILARSRDRGDSLLFSADLGALFGPRYGVEPTPLSGYSLAAGREGDALIVTTTASFRNVD